MRRSTRSTRCACRWRAVRVVRRVPRAARRVSRVSTAPTALARRVPLVRSTQWPASRVACRVRRTRISQSRVSPCAWGARAARRLLLAPYRVVRRLCLVRQDRRVHLVQRGSREAVGVVAMMADLSVMACTKTPSALPRHAPLYHISRLLNAKSMVLNRPRCRAPLALRYNKCGPTRLVREHRSTAVLSLLLARRRAPARTSSINLNALRLYLLTT